MILTTVGNAEGKKCNILLGIRTPRHITNTCSKAELSEAVRSVPGRRRKAAVSQLFLSSEERQLCWPGSSPCSRAAEDGR